MEEEKWIDFEAVKRQAEEEISKTEISKTQPNNALSEKQDNLNLAITKDYGNALGELQQTNDYKETIKKVVEEGAKAKLEADMLSILTDKQKNELAKYALDCEKKQLEYRKKKEKRLIKQQVNADIICKKTEIQKQKYGYLYEKDENGEPKDFVPNGFVNKFKALANWYSGLGDGIKKIIVATLKLGFFALIIFLGFKGFKWLTSKGL